MSSLDPSSVSVQQSTSVPGRSFDSVDISVWGFSPLSGVASGDQSEPPASERSSGAVGVGGRGLVSSPFSGQSSSPVSVVRGRQTILDPLALDAAIEAARVPDGADLGVPPDSNTGGKVGVRLALGDLFMRPRLLRQVVIDGVDVEVWEIWVYSGSRHCRQTVNFPVHQSALLDTFTFTFRESMFQALMPSGDWVSDAELCQAVGGVLLAQIGLECLDACGSRNHYAHARQLVKSAADPISAGFVAAGGNRDTVCVHITGEGCKMLSRVHWVALYALLVSLGAKVTRADLAHDDFSGSASVDYAAASFKAGCFSGSGRPPGCSVDGDWIMGDPMGKGRTLYVGSRQSGKYLRVYEKGRQMGDPDSVWVRWELELHCEGRVIPFDVILDPGRYLAGAYPATGWISEAQSVIKTISKGAKIAYASLVASAARSYGRMLWVMREIEGGADAVLDLLTKGVDDVPRRLILPIGA